MILSRDLVVLIMAILNGVVRQWKELKLSCKKFNDSRVFAMLSTVSMLSNVLWCGCAPFCAVHLYARSDVNCKRYNQHLPYVNFIMCVRQWQEVGSDEQSGARQVVPQWLWRPDSAGPFANLQCQMVNRWPYRAYSTAYVIYYIYVYLSLYFLDVLFSLKSTQTFPLSLFLYLFLSDLVLFYCIAICLHDVT